MLKYRAIGSVWGTTLLAHTVKHESCRRKRQSPRGPCQVCVYLEWGCCWAQVTLFLYGWPLFGYPRVSAVVSAFWVMNGVNAGVRRGFYGWDKGTKWGWACAVVHSWRALPLLSASAVLSRSLFLLSSPFPVTLGGVRCLQLRFYLSSCKTARERCLLTTNVDPRTSHLVSTVSHYLLFLGRRWTGRWL